jgi:metallo-beta-lactamase class B
MEEDVAMVEDGGKSDFHYGRDWQVMAHHTPGHTRGATTWTTTLLNKPVAANGAVPAN